MRAIIVNVKRKWQYKPKEENKMKQELRDYLEEEIFQSELSIDESWIGTTYRWIYGNKYSLIEGTDFDEFEQVCL